MKKYHSFLFVIILMLNLGILTAGIFTTQYWGQRTLAIASASIGMITFLGMLAINYGPGLVIERAMRNAIAASVVTMYIAIVGMTTFFTLIFHENNSSAPELAPLTKLMIDSFQNIVTIVIGFYFTSSTIIEGIQRYKTGKISEKDDSSAKDKQSDNVQIIPK
jgi:membrane protease YdiL (CAAX protease family)